MARPVVTTPEGFEGLRAMPGRDLLVAKAPDAIARSITDVLEYRYPNLGSAARKAVEQYHDWQRTLPALDTWIAPRSGNYSKRKLISAVE